MMKNWIKIPFAMLVLLLLLVLSVQAQTLSGAGWHYENAVLTITDNAGAEISAEEIGLNQPVEEIVIEEGVIIIGDRAFCGIPGLVKVTLPDTLTRIGSEAFMDCGALTEITIPGSVTSIGCGAFRGCAGLETIIFEGEPAAIGECSGCGSACVFSGCTAEVFYPAGEWNDSAIAAYSRECILRWNPVVSTEEWIAAASASCTQHTPVYIPGVEPTCVTYGMTGGSQCSVCGEILAEQEIIPATGHTWSEQYTIEPTCTEEGSRFTVCLTCSLRNTIETIPAAGHSPMSIPAVEPTCTMSGSSEGSYCSVCYKTLTTSNIIPAKGHSSSHVDAVPPTCTQSGLSEGEICLTCGEMLQEQVVIPALGHTPGDDQTVVRQPTCGQVGLLSSTCSACHQVVLTEIPTLDHEWDGPFSIEPDCVNEGSVFEICLNCSARNILQTSPALGHTEMVIEGFAPTCYENGLSDGLQCIDCGEMLVEPEMIPATGHTPSEENIAYESPTCTMEGYLVSICTVCYQDFYEIIPPTGHSWVLSSEKKPTCTASGQKTYTCEYCSITNTESVAAAGHSWAGPFTTEPTCTAEGKRYNACKTCHLEEVLSTIPATGHTRVVVPAVAPTCTSRGLTQGEKCSACGKVFVAQKTISATGHTIAADQTLCDAVLGGDAVLSLRFLCGDSSAISWTAQDTAKLKLTSASHKNGVSTATFDVNAPGMTTVLATFADGITEPVFFTVIAHSDRQLILPDTLSRIDDEAFLNAPVQEIILPGTLKTIGARAFADCADLALVYMPDSIETIAPTAFQNCTKVSFLCASRNAAATFAAERGIPYLIVG